jgi:cation diffusion facilitator family transporter
VRGHRHGSHRHGHGHGHGDHGHGDHGHGDHSGGAYLDERAASGEGLRALLASLGGLGITAGLQLVVVVLSGSVALLADTVHNLADALTAVPLGVALVIGRRRPNRRYPYGYGRAEDLAGLVIVAVIASSAAVAAWQAIGRLTDPRGMDHAGWVMLAGLVGFAGNELVARYRIRVGERIGSAALVADGLHARTDALASLAVVGAAAGSLAGWELADPLVGLVISAAILDVLRVVARDIYRRLMDGVDPGLVARVDAELSATPGIRGVDRVRVRWMGHRLHVDADVVVDGGLQLARAHDILEDARHRLFHHVPRLADALLHASPDHASSPPAADPHAATRHHLAPG